MRVIIPVSLLLGFIAGYSVNTMFKSEPIELAMINSSPIESEINSYSETESVEQKLDVILSQLNDLSINIENQQISYEDMNRRDIEARDDTSNSKINLTDKEIGDAKSGVYNALLDTNFTLTELLNSEQLNSLPTEEKKEVLDEVARRIDSGEINKMLFLPGYKSAVN